MLNREIACTIFQVFGMTRPGIEPRPTASGLVRAFFLPKNKQCVQHIAIMTMNNNNRLKCTEDCLTGSCKGIDTDLMIKEKDNDRIHPKEAVKDRRT